VVDDFATTLTNLNAVVGNLIVAADNFFVTIDNFTITVGGLATILINFLVQL
jgi:hypothetical protein